MQYLVHDHPSNTETGVNAGDIVEAFTGNTYGLLEDCIHATGEDHVAVSYDGDEFLIVPRAAVTVYRN